MRYNFGNDSLRLCFTFNNGIICDYKHNVSINYKITMLILKLYKNINI